MLSVDEVATLLRVKDEDDLQLIFDAAKEIKKTSTATESSCSLPIRFQLLRERLHLLRIQVQEQDGAQDPDR